MKASSRYGLWTMDMDIFPLVTQAKFGITKCHFQPKIFDSFEWSTHLITFSFSQFLMLIF